MENHTADNEKSDVRIPHENIRETIKENNCDGDINISKKNKQLKFDKGDEVSSITERTFSDDEMWNIDDDSDSDGDTIGNGMKIFSSLSDLFKKNTSTDLKTGKKKLAAVKKSSNPNSDTLKTSTDKELMKQAMKKKSDFLFVENKDPQGSKNIPIENSVQEMSSSPDAFNQELSSVNVKKENLLAAAEKSSNSSSNFSKISSLYKEIVKKEIIKQRAIEQEIIKTRSNFPAKKKKHLQHFEKSNVLRKLAQLENEVRSELEVDQELYDIDKNSFDCSDQSDLKSYWVTSVPSNSTDLSNPSCSISLPGSSIFSELSSPSNSSTYVDENTILFDESKFLLNFYNKVHLNDFSSLREMSEEIIEVSPLEECILVKELSKRTNSISSDEDSDSSDSFVEDPDIVNPDILYNINLNEYYTQMELLVQKISESPEDQTVLAECMTLPPIPEIEHERKKFTEGQIYNFENGVAEYEYEIDSDDWNKIMVKRAVVFTAHAGFTIANEESLYVLADVAIDYIKMLAVVMKNNFDIQENCSYPDCIDPIENSLIQIGVEGGIAELIRHYENDVFGKRDKLIKKCQHLQKIIDQYTERMLTINTKTQMSSKGDFVRENPTSEKVMVKEEITQKEDKTEIETTLDEVQTEIFSTIEEVEIETQSTLVENVLVNVNVDQTEPVYIDKTNRRMKIETNEKIKSKPVISCQHNETMNNKSMFIDTLKRLNVKPGRTSLNDMCAKDVTSVGTTDLEQPLIKCSDISSSSKKKKKFLDFATVKKWLKQFYPQEEESETELDEAEEAKVIRKRLQEHATEFNALLESYVSYNNSLSTDSDDNLVDNKITLPQTVIVTEKSDKNEASSLNINNTIQNIPTPVVANKNDNCDYKIL